MNIQPKQFKAQAFEAATQHGAVIIDADGQAFRFDPETYKWEAAYDGEWRVISTLRMETYRDAYASWIVVRPNVEHEQARELDKQQAEGRNRRFSPSNCKPVAELLTDAAPNESKGMSFAEARKEMRETGAIFSYSGSNMIYAVDPLTDELMWRGIDSSKPFEHTVPDMREQNDEWRKLRDASESDTFR